jgi:hypothetical protein
MNLVHADKFSLSDFEFYANTPNKAIWVFHSPTGFFGGKFLKVIGRNEQTKEETLLISDMDMTVGYALDPSVTKLATTIEFPSLGQWHLDVYVSDEFYGKVNIKVR